ncbi:kinase-like protein [Rhizophagus irregularis]|uniref:Kinase-like protein n=1 Tax=Rhizophagus irregularis TaxID=588596 RepID=A0A2N0P9D7_9GLOM|nr:kinase-like protein [Rhizophagus irregularis]
MSRLESTNANNENSFDPTPKLKSSPIPILFISFNRLQNECSYCGNEYSVTVLFNQKYCKICLIKYIENISDNSDMYLDIRMSTNDIRHNKNETSRNVNFCTQNIQENKKVQESENCKLCGKLFPEQSCSFKICPDCYQISHGRLKSTLTKEFIPILCLPWWDNCNICINCKLSLEFISDCQKWCSDCFATYTGCRYCLTTNIIFGNTAQSQCKKCNRLLSFITITYIDSENFDIEKFLASTRVILNRRIFDSFVKDLNSLEIYDAFFRFKNDYYRYKSSVKWIRWIPYSRITNLEKIAEGGFSIIYKAQWRHFNQVEYYKKTVIIKRFLNSWDMDKYFLNELKSLCNYKYDADYIIGCYGITQNPETKEFMLIMQYANGGNLHDYLQENFTNITWEMKLNILSHIAMGLLVIHARNFIHRDFHSGNILLSKKSGQRWLIGDLGLSQSANNTLLNNEIYGIMPYIAPEIFKGAAFSKESDIYSMGMIMWELTTGCKPFASIRHDANLVYEIIDGERPEITHDTPECFANLMKSCWDSNPSERPSALEVAKALSSIKATNDLQFYQAEEKRLELIKLKKLGPEYTGKSHSGAIYTFRLLGSRITNSLFK